MAGLPDPPAGRLRHPAVRDVSVQQHHHRARLPVLSGEEEGRATHDAGRRGTRKTCQ